MIKYKEVTDLSSEELRIFTDLNENQLKRFYEPYEGLFICESPKVIGRALKAGYEPVSVLFSLQQLNGEGREILESLPDIPAFAAEEKVLKEITGYNLTSGMLCAVKRKPLMEVPELIRNANRVTVLEDVENPTNVGAIFRSAAAMGIDAVILTKGCSDPLYRRAARVSVGTVFQIPWTFAGAGYPDELKAAGFKLAAMALSDNSVRIDDSELKAEEKLAIILGNEENGILQSTLDKSDYVVKIPMKEGIDSLNVAAASAVAFWELGK